MKILIVHNAYQSHLVGGEDIVVKQEVSALKAILGESHVFEYVVSNDDIKLSEVAQNIWGDCQHYQAIKTLVETHRISIVHVHNFFPLLTPSIFAGAKAAGAKVIQTLHNFRWWCMAGTFYRKGKGSCETCVGKSLALPGIIHRCYRGSYLQSTASALAFAWYRFKNYQQYIDAYFCLSHFQHQKLSTLISPTQLLYKPNSITPAINLIPLAEKKGYLFVGRLESAKGIELLLEAWQRLPSHFELTVIGKGEDEDRLKARFRSKKIVFLGQLPHEQTLAYIAKARYLMHTSTAYETFGLTIVEALARQTPVIGFSHGTRNEMITHGKNGFLCEEEELTQMILFSLEVANYEQMANQALSSAKQFYIEPVLKQQIAHYKAVLQENAHV
jgi:glycosyltransferase involved in cell wall biosynthesis